MYRPLAVVALAGLVAGSLTMGASVPANAAVDVSVGIGAPMYYGYNFHRPCAFYNKHELPAPARCYRAFQGFYGPTAYLSGGFVFRDHDAFNHWRDRDDFRHWRDHDGRGDRHGEHAHGGGHHGR